MALFKKKNPTESADGITDVQASDGATGQFQSQPDKARKWFEHAKSMADRYNYESALVYYASGIKFDPEQLGPHKAMYESAIQYANKGGKPASSKDAKAIGTDKDLGTRLAVCEYLWMTDITNADLGLKTLEAVASVEAAEVGRWMAKQLVGIIHKSKKLKKGMARKAADLFGQVGAFDESLGMLALVKRLDPTDSEVEALITEMSAQRTMEKGGYEKATGEEGGFRNMVRDIDKQRELEEMESISGSATVEERNLARAKSDYETNPSSADFVNKYAQLLKKSGDAEDEEKAYNLYLKGFKDSSEYRLRMAAGDIRIEQGRRKQRELAEKLEADPDNAELQEQVAEARRERLEYEGTEFAERAKKYPTNRTMRYDLGVILFELGNFEEAMANFQTAKEEPRFKVRAGHSLGRCFAAENWHMEAIAEFNEAIESIDVTEKDLELDIRYDLMVSLIAEARNTGSVDLARDALNICSSITRRDITFRDIRARRKEIDTLVKELGG